MTAPRTLVPPRWLVFGAVSTVGGVCLGIVVLDRLLTPEQPWWQGLLLLLVVALAWGLELSAVAWPRLLFVLVGTGAAGWLRYVQHAEIAPILLMPLVAWVAYTDDRRTGLLAALAAEITLLPYVLEPGTFWPWTTGIVFTWAAGRALARQERLLLELRAAQADLRRQVAAEERRRIAREIHDVAAHSLAVTMLHLTGARLLLQRVGGDPRAVDALAEAERLGRQSLDDVRRTVGLLEEGASGSQTGPLPSGSDLRSLIDEYRDAGLDVSFAAEGDVAGLAPAVGLALYRITQEALANVVKHAPGAHADVTLRSGDPIMLDIRNSTAQERPALTPDRPSGRGLAGMRERTELLGGALEAGPEGGGWRVSCSIPVQQPASARSVLNTDQQAAPA